MLEQPTMPPERAQGAPSDRKYPWNGSGEDHQVPELLGMGQQSDPGKELFAWGKYGEVEKWLVRGYLDTDEVQMLTTQEAHSQLTRYGFVDFSKVMYVYSGARLSEKGRAREDFKSYARGRNLLGRMGQMLGFRDRANGTNGGGM